MHPHVLGNPGGIQHIQLVPRFVIGGSGKGGIQLPGLTPGALFLQVPVEEHRIPVRIPENALQRGFHRLHRHLAGGGNRRIQLGGRRDDALAFRQAGDKTLLVHRSHRRIGRAPNDAPVRGGPGQYRGAQLGRVLQDNAAVGRGNLHRTHLVCGLCPAAAGGVL